MKRIVSILLAMLLLTGLLGALPVSAAGSATISVNKSSVTVGTQVTVTAKFSGGGKGIGSLDAYFNYNSKVFEYVSCTGGTAAGGAGTVKISYFCQEATAPKNVTITIKLKAIGVGSGDFKWTTEGMYDDNDSLLGKPGKSLSVSVTNPTKSGDATLSSLSPSKGTLSPKFSKTVTNYTVTVPYSVTRCLLNYSTTDSQAKTTITGSADLKVGKNTRTITVTAQNGTTKKYTVVITRQENTGESTTATQNTASTGTTSTTAPTEQPTDALAATVNGKEYHIAETQTTEKLPTNFEWSFVTIHGVDVPAGKHKNADLTLLYLVERDADNGGFFLYDQDTETFSPYYKLSLKSAVYAVHDVPDGQPIPVGTVRGTFTYKDVVVIAYLYKAESMKDFAILQVTTPEGVTGLYIFDSVEKTFQRYMGTDHITAADSTPTSVAAPVVQEENEGGFLTFLRENQKILLICAAAAGALALLILGVVVLMRTQKGGNGKH